MAQGRHNPLLLLREHVVLGSVADLGDQSFQGYHLLICETLHFQMICIVGLSGVRFSRNSMRLFWSIYEVHCYGNRIVFAGKLDSSIGTGEGQACGYAVPGIYTRCLVGR